MTFVIITSGIDLSIGSVLVFSGVVAAKVMQGMGGDGWGTAFVGIAAVGRCPGWPVGRAQRRPDRQGQDPAADRHPRHAGRWRSGLAQIITGGVDIRDGADRAAGHDRLRQRPRHDVPIICRDRAGVRGDLRRRGAAPTRFGRYTYAVGSNEESARRVGVKVDRHLILVYALSGAAGRRRRDPVARPVRHDGHRRPVADQPQRHRRRRDRRHVASSAASARSSARSSACSSRPCCRTAS